MLRLSGVSKRYPNGHQAVADVDLEVDAGRLVALIGGSGCGKSTLLRLVAGLEAPTQGAVSVAGRPVVGPSEKVGVVFQEPRLMPWLDVARNVSFGLGELTADEGRRVALEAIARVGLSGFEDALPRQLSGGMAQRTALARALVGSPDVLLLDEPFSSLDALIRADLQQHLLDLWASDRRTMLLVTHDIDEALLLADEIVVMAGSPGRVVDRMAVGAERPRHLVDADLMAVRERVMTSLSVAGR